MTPLPVPPQPGDASDALLRQHVLAVDLGHTLGSGRCSTRGDPRDPATESPTEFKLHCMADNYRLVAIEEFVQRLPALPEGYGDTWPTADQESRDIAEATIKTQLREDIIQLVRIALADRWDSDELETHCEELREALTP